MTPPGPKPSETPRPGTARPLRLRTRLMMGMILVTALMLVVIEAAVPRRLDESALQGSRARADAGIRVLQGALEPALAEGDDDAVLDILNPFMRAPDAQYVIVRTADGRSLRAVSTPRIDGLSHDLPLATEPLTTVPLVWLDPGEESLHAAAELRAPDGRVLGTVTAGFSLDGLDAQRQANRFFAAIVGAGLAAVSWITMALVSTTITRPIRRLTATARKVAEGHLDLVELKAGHIHPDARDEVAQLTRVFAQMLDRLRVAQTSLEERIRAEEAQRREAERQRAEAEAHKEQLREALDLVEQAQTQLLEAEKLATLGQLVAGIAHEVNTPLGAIQASSEVIEELLVPTLDGWHRSFRDARGPVAQAALARAAVADGPTLSSRERRRLRRQLFQDLAARELDEAADLAERALELGLSPDDPLLGALLDEGEAGLALRTTEELSTLVRNTRNIRTAAARARTVVLALKTFVRTGPTEERVVLDVVESLSTVLTLYNNQLKVGVEVVLEYEQAPKVRGNPDELSQVWTNLIQNALHAMEQRGVLRLTVELHEGRVRVGIANDGPPIPEHVLPRIFEPFYTTKPAGEGSGLGLDIVRKVVERHGGGLSVASAPDWTTFTVELPEWREA